MSSVIEQAVHASETTGVTPMLNVSQSVLSTLSVPATWPVSTSTVLTPARVCVATTPRVMSTITSLTADVTRDTPGMPSLAVQELQHVRLRIIQKDGILICVCLIPAPAPTEVIDPCNPSPCGQNAICTARSRAGACQCIPEYFGDPYVACRPECTINADCPAALACVNLHCVDPCPGVCGVNAQCRAVNHAPTCTCNPGYRGDPFTACSLIPQSKSKYDNVDSIVILLGFLNLPSLANFYPITGTTSITSMTF